MAGTRKVRMLAGVSGSRHDGEPWPPAGETIAVPDWEAHDLVTGGNAVYEDDDLPVAHVGETVPASAPPGTEGHGRVFEGQASAGEIMTGHPADEAAGVRAAKDQHGLRGADEGAGTHRVSGLREHADDPRPDSQILAEDFTPEEIEKIDLGQATMSGAKAGPAGQRRKDREAAQREIAGRRQAERDSALRYAEEGGITGAPGSEVPAGEAFPQAGGVRPATQAEAEDVPEGMTDLEKAEFASRMPDYGGQPAGEDEPGAGDRAADEATGGRHRVTAASESPISVTEEGTAAEPEDAKPAKAGNENAPAPSAPKQEWVDYAVREHGMDVHEAGAMTKADLMSRFGGRL